MQKLKTDENQRLKQCLPASVTIAACAVNVNPLKDSQPIKGSLCSFPFYYLEAQTAGDFFARWATVNFCGRGFVECSANA